MARTRFGASAVAQGTLDIQLEGAEYKVPTAPFKVGKAVLNLVQLPCSAFVKENAGYFEFEKGLRKNEWAWYLQDCHMFLFRQSYKNEQEAKLALKQYVFIFFGGRVAKFFKCLRQMADSQAKGKARRIRDFFVRKYGVWQFGLHSVTMTIGLENLEARREEFSYLWTNAGSDTMRNKEPPVSHEPRVAYRSCCETYYKLLLAQHEREKLNKKTTKGEKTTDENKEEPPYETE